VADEPAPQTPSATGTFATTPCAHVLISARNRRTTGELDVRAPDGRHAALAFWRGRVTEARTSPTAFYLGDVLVDLGWVTREARDAALRDAAAARRRSGEVLVERRFLSAAQRDAALREQIHRRVHHLFAFPAETRFALFEAAPASAEPPLLADVVVAVWRGLRSHRRADIVGAVLERHASLRVRMCNEAPLDHVELTAAERKLVAMLSSAPMTLAQMRAAGVGLSPEEVDLVAYFLIIAKCVEPFTPSAPTMAAVQPPTPSRPEALRSALSARPPGGTPGAFRPTAPPSPSPAAPTGPVRGPGELGPHGIAARARAIANESYFQILGVAEGAPEEMVRAAYLRLTKLWHPDRLPTELAACRTDAQTIFSALTRAHQTLTDATARRGYLATRAEQAVAATSRRAEAIRSLERALLRKDYAAAQLEAQRLFDADGDDAEALAVLAWTTAKAGEAPPDTVRAAIATLDRAVLGDKRCKRAFLYRAMLHKQTGNAALAHKDFARVVELDPKHVDAQREVRLYEMRRRDSGEVSRPKKK
jgi:hypothetical protein